MSMAPNTTTTASALQGTSHNGDSDAQVGGTSFHANAASGAASDRSSSESEDDDATSGAKRRRPGEANSTFEQVKAGRADHRMQHPPSHRPADNTRKQRRRAHSEQLSADHQQDQPTGQNLGQGTRLQPSPWYASGSSTLGSIPELSDEATVEQLLGNANRANNGQLGQSYMVNPMYYPIGLPMPYPGASAMGLVPPFFTLDQRTNRGAPQNPNSTFSGTLQGNQTAQRLAWEQHAGSIAGVDARGAQIADLSAQNAGKERSDAMLTGVEVQAVYGQVQVLHRIGVVEESVRAQAEGLKDFSEKVLSRIDDLTTVVTAPVKPHRSARKDPASSTRSSRTRDRDGDDNMTGNDDFPPVEKEAKDPGVRALERAIRFALKALLRVKQYDELPKKYPTLTDAEADAVLKGHPSAIQCTPQSFRVDFERPWSAFDLNQAARFTFIQYFQSCGKGGKVGPHVVPKKYLTADVIGIALDNHMDYVRNRYRLYKSQAWEATLNAERKRCSVNSRKATTFSSRLRIVNEDSELQDLLPIFARMTAEHMSGDETDEEDPDKFCRIDAEWMSDKMRALLHSLDDTVREDRRHPIGTRKAAGRGPRVRLPSKGKSQNSPAPRGLPINCYNQCWLDKLKPYQRARLAPQNEQFDFDAVLPESEPMVQG